jgi:transposase
MAQDRFDHSVDHSDVTKPARLQRVEVITGVERRRRWSTEEKLRVVAESFAEGAVVSEVARRNGLSPQQLFGWRAKVRAEVGTVMGSEPPLFAPAMVAETASRPAVAAELARRRDEVPSIEIRLGAAVVGVRGRVDARTLAAVLKALKVLA